MKLVIFSCHSYLQTSTFPFFKNEHLTTQINALYKKFKEAKNRTVKFEVQFAIKLREDLKGIHCVEIEDKHIIT